jgi:ABC-type glycerol-3-phosphate transport system substrate-binding protein
VNDPATAWRLFYTLYGQAGGKVLADNGKKVVLDEAGATKVLGFIYQLATEGLMNANVDSNGGGRHWPEVVGRRGLRGLRPALPITVAVNILRFSST